MVQQVEGSVVREDRLTELSTPRLLGELALRAQGRRCWAIVRNEDGKFYTGHMKTGGFSGKGKLYTAGLYQALTWYKSGSYWLDNVVQPGGRNLDLSDYTIVEYSAIEAERVPADKWLEAHGKKA